MNIDHDSDDPPEQPGLLGQYWRRSLFLLIRLVLQFIGILALLLFVVRSLAWPEWTGIIAFFIAFALMKSLVVVEAWARLTELERNVNETMARWAAEPVHATICVDVDNEQERVAVDRWFEKWSDRVTRAENRGCGCCVNIWSLEGPREAFKELPQQVLLQGMSTD